MANHLRVGTTYFDRRAIDLPNDAPIAVEGPDTTVVLPLDVLMGGSRGRMWGGLERIG